MSQGDQAFRKHDPKGRWAEMTYGGALSFLRRPYSRDLANVDVAVWGVPFDSAVTYRPGCRLGPRAIRAASVQLAELKAFPFGFDPFDHLAVVDWGDVMLDPHHPETVAPMIEAQAAGIIASGAKSLALGGDHFIAWPLLKAHAAAHGPLALIQFDAHGDLWPDDPDRIDHGTMMGRAIAEGIVDPAASTQIGIRTYHDSDMGLEILSAPWIHRNGVEAALDVAVARAGARPVYVSFDIDVLDPAFAPGTGTPVPGGLASWQALEILRGLASLDLVGLDVVEVSPPFDVSEITAIAGATVAHDWLCLLAERKGAARRPVGRL
ncbi:agmatinase [Halovulum dunhuangense]|uniref:Agmatinase n=1 Tax=Halovulum dunhuangense TaxID=1505036 RepID=A0A849L0Q5_9RHOB|nr:agmatinase [Halovulum dunhuangense]NNU79852.1 agmatinase [Halovulum dunhuangense]